MSSSMELGLQQDQKKLEVRPIGGEDNLIVRFQSRAEDQGEEFDEISGQHEEQEDFYLSSFGLPHHRSKNRSENYFASLFDLPPTKTKGFQTTMEGRRYITLEPPGLQRPTAGPTRRTIVPEDKELSKYPLDVQLRIGQTPLKPISSYRIFVKENTGPMRKLHQTISHKELMTKLNTQWFTELSEEDREAYRLKGMLDRQRYRDELIAYNRNRLKVLTEYADGQKKQKETTTPAKQAGAEKEDMENCLSSEKQSKVKFKSAFKFFKLDMIAKVKDEYPTLSFKERVEIIKEQWKRLAAHEKFLYVKRSRLDKKR
eukprot:TRINITY_DN1539_c0_g1_i3.p1 TRINITY_DN1539_c0_g1~~TRINITY_DN1539_c0_g1_i3.p1  ORF type:complete len:314 (+),score=81.13 TRINITY_DN1539_c0_g1_i3:548-1489(+)